MPGACQGCDIAGVHPGGEEGADLHISHLVGLDRILDGLVDGVDQVLQILLALAKGRVVILVDVHLPVPEGEPMALGKLEYALEEGLGKRRILEGHVGTQGLGVELLVEVRMLQEALDLRSVHEGAAHPGVIEGLDTEVVPSSEELATFAVPDDEGKHAAQAVDHLVTPLLVAMQDDLGVGLGGEGMSQVDQLAAQFTVVVDLPVHGDGHGGVLVEDGLVAALQVDDAQAPKTQSHPPINEMPLIVGASVGNDVRHPLEHGRFFLGRGVVDEPSNSAHWHDSLSIHQQSTIAQKGNRKQTGLMLGLRQNPMG